MKRRITLNFRSLRPRTGILPVVQTPKSSASAISFSKTTKTTSTKRTSKFKGEKVSKEKVEQLLKFLNNIEDVKTLADLRTMGPLVGRRILERKNTFQEFTSLSQLEDISGFGPLKFKDLLAKLA